MATLKNFKNKSRQAITEYIIERNRKRSYFYEIICKFVSVAESRKIRLIVENPYSPHHYLINNFLITPALIDKNRRERGDCFIKPTMYYFVNCEPVTGLITHCPPP